MARIELKGIAKSWGPVTAVEPTDLAIEDGEFAAILGPSGCGKSTTLCLLAGIYAPSAGDILFDGVVVNEVEAKDRNVGIVFQSYALYPHMTVRENIRFPLRFKALPAAEAAPRVDAIARLVQVDGLLDRRPAQLSGGQQQRVALARALVKEPQLLLLDEPLSNLDASLRLTMRTEIKRLQRRLGVTTILVTHDQVEAMTMADRIVCMAKGRIEQVGAPEDLYRRPASLFVAGFVGSPPINLLEGKAESGRVVVGDLAFPLRGEAAGSITLGIRPESLRIAAGGIEGRIEHVEPMGREILYVVSTTFGTVRLLEAGQTRRHAPGDTVGVAIDPDAIIAFDGTSGTLLPGARVEAPAASGRLRASTGAA